jgi:phage shock protein A
MESFGSLDVGDTLKELNTVMQNFNTALNKLQSNLDEMNLSETSANLQKLTDEMRQKVAELPVEQLGEDGRTMMKTVTAAAGEMQGLVDRLEDSPLLNEKAVGSIVRDFQSSAANFRILSENLRDTPSLMLWGKPPKRTVIEPRSRQ